MCTFEIFKDVLVKMWIPRHWIFLSAKVIVSKYKSSLRSELSLSVLQDILTPRGVLTVLLRIRLNIFHQTEQLMAVYLNCYVSQRLILSGFFYIRHSVIQKSPGHGLSGRVTEISTSRPNVLQRGAVIPLSWQQIMVHETCTLSFDAG